MAQKNKINVMFARYLNELNVNRRRRIELRINYLIGLVDAYQKDADMYLLKETKYVNDLYESKIAPLQKRLDGESKNDSIRLKKLASFDEKLYWQRRKYKTSQLRKVSKEEVEELLQAFDETAKINRADMIHALEAKYPHQDLSVEEKQDIELRIKTLHAKKDEHLALVKEKYEKKSNKVAKFKHANDKKLARLENTNQKLEAQIINFSQKRFEEDKVLLAETTKKLESLQGVESKQSRKLQQKILKIKTVMDMIEQDDIHLSVSDLRMYFGGVKAVNDLSFNVKKGEVFGLIGPNGAGKTTVFNCITQFYRATSGQMIFKNKEGHIVDLSQLKTHDMISEGIARSFQNVELIWELTVLDNLLVAAHSLITTTFFDHMLHTPKWKREELVLRTKGLEILKNLGIIEYAFRSPYGLPYGVLKKVELARTLMTNPSLIILDEPAAGLNDIETEDLAKVIKQINKEYDVTIFLVEHDMGLVMSICDRICAISFGKRIGLGTPKEIQQNPEVRKAYLGDDSDE